MYGGQFFKTNTWARTIEILVEPSIKYALYGWRRIEQRRILDIGDFFEQELHYSLTFSVRSPPWKGVDNSELYGFGAAVTNKCLLYITNPGAMAIARCFTSSSTAFSHSGNITVFRNCWQCLSGTLLLVNALGEGTVIVEIKQGTFQNQPICNTPHNISVLFSNQQQQ